MRDDFTFVFHVHITKGDPVPQLTVLRNISDKYLVEIEDCKPLDLTNHHSLDKTSFLEISHPWISFNQALHKKWCGYQTSRFMCLLKEVKVN